MSRSSRAESHQQTTRDWRGLFTPRVATLGVLVVGGVTAVAILLFVGGTAISGRPPFDLPIGPQAAEKVETATVEEAAAGAKREAKGKGKASSTLAIGPSVPVADGAASRAAGRGAVRQVDDPGGFWAIDVAGAEAVREAGPGGTPSLAARIPVVISNPSGGGSSPTTAPTKPGAPTTAPPAVPVPEPTTTLPPITVPEPTDPPTTLPEVTLPPETIPETTLPEVTLPEVTLPEVTLPEVTIPEITLPPLLPLF